MSTTWSTHSAPPRSVQFSHNYASIVLPSAAEQTAPAVVRWARSPAAEALPILWGEAMPNEAPARVCAWPRMTIVGRTRLLRRDQGVAIEVWPWDDEHAEIGLRPSGDRPLALHEVEAWRGLASDVLGQLRAVLMHPSSTLLSTVPCVHARVG